MATKNVTCPIAGIVASIEKQPGDTVAIDEPVVIIECMKVEIPVASPVAGRIGRLTVKVGDAVAEHQPLFAIES